jgi:hypothetical protein
MFREMALTVATAGAAGVVMRVLRFPWVLTAEISKASIESGGYSRQIAALVQASKGLEKIHRLHQGVVVGTTAAEEIEKGMRSIEDEMEKTKRGLGQRYRALVEANAARVRKSESDYAHRLKGCDASYKRKLSQGDVDRRLQDMSTPELVEVLRFLRARRCHLGDISPAVGDLEGTPEVRNALALSVMIEEIEAIYAEHYGRARNLVRIFGEELPEGEEARVERLIEGITERQFRKKWYGGPLPE